MPVGKGTLRRFVQLLAWSAVAMSVVFGVFLVLASHKQTRAKSLLRSAAVLKAGIATFADAQSLAEKYGGVPWNGPLRPARCSSQSCSFRFFFDNKPLNYIPGVRGVQFVVGIDVVDGYVVSREIEFSTLTTSYFEFLYILNDGKKFTDVQDYEVKKLKVDVEGTPHVIEVNLGQLATAEERARAYSIDLACLARLAGCDNPSAVFPVGL
jgi:hypothetical protein